MLTAVITPRAIADDSDVFVTVPSGELTEIRQELQYLRQREAERTVRETAPLTLASLQIPACDSGCDVGCADGGCADGCCADGGCDGAAGVCDGCLLSNCGSKGSLCGCLCHHCVPPICPAPCVECPRVTTLNPYFNINVFGALKLDMLFSNPRPVTESVPFFLAPASAGGYEESTVSFQARQSTIGAAFAGPQFGGFQSGGQMIAMFFNDSVIQDAYGFLPLQAYGELKNDRWRFSAGLQFDVFAPGIPTVLPFSALGASGNAGNSFRGQLRAERYFNPASDVQWTLQMALSEPINATIDPTFRLLEDNGWPNVEGRIALGLGDRAGPQNLRPFEAGLSGVVGELRSTPVPNPPVFADVWGGAIDFRWAMNDTFGVLGEVFTGNALGTYNGGILQNINSETLEGVHSTGGFIETYAYLCPRLHTHIGYGIDDPRDEDLPVSAAAAARSKNQTYYANLLWDVNQTFRIAFEFAYRDTEYNSPLLLDNQGPGFHTQLQWLF
ncbi:hypothetical protein FYK55_25135 [Roseiconus nitratireducens]|uniref:Porin n=1 Tax=Roseiconus nitratireducens TaxID=2605748 RepID=A0A5M6CVC9_9BACT|nr:hypothetical protein [Roseiconus nitratireducens]KAA5539208.1 hypothetical protein FYK55_25135 [Roseiconus nitratireducens]